MGFAPHPSPVGDTFPPRGRLDVRKDFEFLLNFALSKAKQGEDTKRLTIFAERKFRNAKFSAGKGSFNKKKGSHYFCFFTNEKRKKQALFCAKFAGIFCAAMQKRLKNMRG